MNQKLVLILCLLSFAYSLSLIRFPTYQPQRPINIFRCFIDFQRGVVEAWKENGESVEKLLGCNRKLEEVHNDIMGIINTIKNIEWTKPRNVIEGLKIVFMEISAICDHIIICLDSRVEVKILLDRILYLSPKELIERLYSNFVVYSQEISDDVYSAINAFYKRDCYTFGFKVGDIVELLFFKIIPKDTYEECT